MTLQDKVWVVTLVVLALVALAFVFVLSNVGKPAEDAGAVTKAAYAIRGRLFAALVLLGLFISYATLADFPIPAQASGDLAPQVVNAVGHQWYWELSATKVAAGVPVEFRVTSADVNHGFAVYDASGRLVAQTQGMPGVTNRLVHRFEAGKYRVMCLEYCGAAHHVMIAEFEAIEGDRS